MNKQNVIDVHCHLFNAQYALKELAAIAWASFCGDYPHAFIGRDTFSTKQSYTIEDFRGLAAYAALLIKTAFSGCEDNLIALKKGFQMSSLSKNKTLVVVPLMMDVYFSCSDNMDEEDVPLRKDIIASMPFILSQDQANEFDRVFDDIRMIVKEELAKLSEEPLSCSKSNEDVNTVLDALFDEVYQDLLPAPIKGLEDAYDGIELSPGYMKHMHDLEALYDKYPEEVVPFLAVDPRRIGIMKLIEMKIAKGSGVFKGIKLYPPLGYLPTHPNLKLIYEYCIDYDIPIIVHCSNGGMENFRNKNYIKSWNPSFLNHVKDFKECNENKSTFYANPEQWFEVMKNYPKLRIDFAHFGGLSNIDSSSCKEWPITIIKLMEMYDNVYADVAYFMDLEASDIIMKEVSLYPILCDRLMFGTDFIMIMKDMRMPELSTYFGKFSDLGEKLLSENAKKFLKQF